MQKKLYNILRAIHCKIVVGIQVYKLSKKKKILFSFISYLRKEKFGVKLIKSFCWPIWFWKYNQSFVFFLCNSWLWVCIFTALLSIIYQTLLLVEISHFLWKINLSYLKIFFFWFYKCTPEKYFFQNDQDAVKRND